MYHWKLLTHFVFDRGSGMQENLPSLCSQHSGWKSNCSQADVSLTHYLYVTMLTCWLTFIYTVNHLYSSFASLWFCHISIFSVHLHNIYVGILQELLMYKQACFHRLILRECSKCSVVTGLTEQNNGDDWALFCNLGELYLLTKSSYVAECTCKPQPSDGIFCCGCCLNLQPVSCSAQQRCCTVVAVMLYP